MNNLIMKKIKLLKNQGLSHLNYDTKMLSHVLDGAIIFGVIMFIVPMFMMVYRKKFKEMIV